MVYASVRVLSLVLSALAAAQHCADDTCAAGSEEEAAAMLQLKSGGETPALASSMSSTSGAPQLGEKCGTCGGTGFTYGDCAPGLVCKPASGSRVGGCPTCQKPPAPAPTPVGAKEGEKCGTCGGTGFTYGDCAPGLVCKPLSGNRVGGCPTCQKPPAPAPTPVGAKEGEKCGFASDGFTYPDCQSGLNCMEPLESAGIGAYSKCVRKCGTVPDKVTGRCGTGTACSCNTMPCRSWEDNCFMYCC